MTDSIDPPIDPMDYVYGVNVVDIGEARVSRGKSRRPFTSCRHLRTVYDTSERRIWCEDCETTLDPFDAFMSLVVNYDTAHKKLLKVYEEVLEAREHSLVSRAAKSIDKVWRGKTMAPCCKSCGAGLLPEDYADGARAKVSREMERARRKRDGGAK